MKKVAVKKAKYIRLMESLVKGQTFSREQIEKRFDVKSARCALYHVRSLGVNVECYKDTKGNSRYRFKG